MRHHRVLIHRDPRRVLLRNQASGTAYSRKLEGYKARKGPGYREPRRKGKLGLVLEGGIVSRPAYYCDHDRK